MIDWHLCLISLFNIVIVKTKVYYYKYYDVIGFYIYLLNER